MQNKKSPINLGDVVFFQQVRPSPTKNEKAIQFKSGHWGFGVMLGIKPPFMATPKSEHLMALMGRAGYMAFDDIKNFLGEENMKICIQKFEEKYCKPQEEQKPKSNLILPHNPEVSQ